MDAPTRALRPPDATAPDTAFPDAATRHKPPDAPRSGKELSRVHPARDALALAAPRLSSPRHKICAGRRSLAASPQSSRALRLTALPCNGGLGLRQKQACRVFADRAVLRDSRNVLLRRSGRLPHLVQRRSDRRVKKSAGTLSASRRGGRRPKAMSRAENSLRPAQQLCGIGASPVPRAHFPPVALTKRTECPPRAPQAPSRGPSRGSRARTARQHLHAAPTLGHNGSRAAHRQKNIPSFKLENPSAAEAGDGNESTKEIPYLPSFLRRVRTVSDSSAPLPTQA